MSERACYIQRSDRGALIRTAWLLGERTSERWDAEPAVDALSAEQTARETAEWIRARLNETRSAKRLDTMCLDTDGAACSWVRGRDAETELIRSAIDGAGSENSAEEDGLDAAHAGGIGDRLPNLAREIDIDVLSDVTSDPLGRAAVLAAPDAPIRLVLDRLDAMGIRVSRVVTIWHALAEAWDPGARSSSTDHAGIVATDHPPAAVVAIDHESGRLIWSWSREGKLLACGSIRVRRLRSDDRTWHAEVLEHDIARLAGDWLGWSAQLGLCPSRVIVVGQPAPGGMSGGEIGKALVRAWPGTLTDIIGTEDAVGETLRRTLDSKPIGTFAPLSERPTRSHRAAYRWSAVAMLLAAACIAALAGGLFSRASSTRGLESTIRTERTELISAVDPSLALDPFPVQRLDDRIAQLQRRTVRLDIESPRPILRELETLSFVLGMPDVTIELIDLTESLVSIKVRIENISAGEQLDQALRSIGGSELNWRDPNYITNTNDRTLSVTYSASWREPTRPTQNGGAP